MALYDEIAERLRVRIDEGGYALRKFPGEKNLAEEMGVSYMTARRAVTRLVEQGVLVRAENGRAEIPVGPVRESPPRLALLTPAFATPAYARWHAALDRAARERGASIRPFTYVHWEDALLWDALAGFDGTFVLPSSEPLPDALAARMRQLTRPPVWLGEDASRLGLPSVVLYPPVWTQRVLDHLADRGHTRIACFNVQPHDHDTRMRIMQWRLWMAARGLETPCFDDPVAPGDSPYETAPARFAERWTRHPDGFTAVFAVTLAAALGVFRALGDRGLTAGEDMAVATLDGEGMAATLTPSLTAVRDPDPLPFVRVCLGWIAERRPWSGPQALSAEGAEVVERESTRRVPVAAATLT